MRCARASENHPYTDLWLSYVGIAGLLKIRGPVTPEDSAAVERMLDMRVVLGQWRLSIIDLSDASQQPMANKDGTGTGGEQLIALNESHQGQNVCIAVISAHASFIIFVLSVVAMYPATCFAYIDPNAGGWFFQWLFPVFVALGGIWLVLKSLVSQFLRKVLGQHKGQQ
jgi:hypothetical protein